MASTLEILAGLRQRKVDQREQIRADFPRCTSVIEQFRAVFGDGVKAKYFKEGGKTMGKPIPFDGTDVDRILRLVDADAKRAAK